MSESARFWDQQFATEHYKYGTEPNAFVVAQAFRLPPPRQILLPGDGEGRNSVWLAEQGHDVVAVDASQVGLDKGQALATRRGVRIQTVCADLAAWTPKPQSVDAVVLVFVHLVPPLRTEVHRKLARALRPGGWLLLEAFHPEQLGRASGGPKQADLLYHPQDLNADFEGLLQLRECCVGEVWLDEGPGHQGLGRVTRWVGLRT